MAREYSTAVCRLWTRNGTRAALDGKPRQSPGELHTKLRSQWLTGYDEAASELSKLRQRLLDNSYK